MDLYRDGTTMPAWLVITVLAREFLVTGLRLVASSQGMVLAADWLGKQKTIWQIVLASYLLVMKAAEREYFMAWINPLFDAPAVGRRFMVPALLTITLVVTVWSGAAYVWKNRRLVLDEM
jgi:phosphatidylglycerophosphate synthase